MDESNKRNDIQWLRALAILAVLGFHIWPDYFPYGYLGVDIFFVISGYLMTLILSKSTNQSLLQYYSRRIKRIFPTCLFMITLFLLIGFFVLLPSHFDYLKIEALWSALFINNFSSMLSEKQYFELVSGFKFFLHTWSLGVEIQFYLIAPFLIKFILSKSKPLHLIGLFAIISALSQLLIPLESVSFGLMFCRIWQFLIGASAFCFFQQKSNKNLKINKTNNVMILLQRYNLNNFNSKLPLLLLTAICLNPFNISYLFFIPPIFRLISTFLTGAFIVFNELEPILLSVTINRLLIYIGDASYSIYLFHWPIIIYFKYFAIIDKYGSLFILVFLLFISFIIHEFFEKPFGRISWRINGTFIATCYATILIAFYHHEFDQLDTNDKISVFIRANEKATESCASFYYPFCEGDPLIDKYFTFNHEKSTPGIRKHCAFKLNSTSSTNRTVMITGNSYAFFAIRGILDAIKQSKMNFSKAYYISRPGCVLIAGNLNQKLHSPCYDFVKAQDRLLNAIKPDVIIHFSRIDHIPTMGDIPMRNPSFDSGYQELKRTLFYITKFTQELIIIEPNPVFEEFGYLTPLDVAQALLTNSSISKYNVSTIHHHKINDPSWNRVKEAVKHCPKCSIIPTENLFCSKHICPMVDETTKLAMYCDKSHLTPKTSMKLIPFLLNAMDKKII